jgi:hypothetical protein
MESTKSRLQKAQELVPHKVKGPDREANYLSPSSAEVECVEFSSCILYTPQRISVYRRRFIFLKTRERLVHVIAKV